MLIVVIGGRTGARPIVELVALAFILLGLAFGIIGLFGIRKHGAKGILAPALVGITINGLLIFIFITNFLAARAKAQKAAREVAGFSPVATVSKRENAHRKYQGEEFAFDYDEAYELKVNKQTGQILLQRDDSGIVVTSLHQLVDEKETLNFQVDAAQQEFKKQAYAGFVQNDFEPIEGAIRSGGLIRFSYDKPRTGRIHMDFYILSDQTNSVSMLHIYSDKLKKDAEGRFKTAFISLKDGS